MPKLNIHKIISLKENPINWKDEVHFKSFNDNSNVRCLNGSAHAKRTTNIEEVTCLKCLNYNTAKRYWHLHEQEHGNVHKNKS